MAAIEIDFAVTAVAEVLKTFDQLKIYRSQSLSTGPWLEITSPSTRLPLVQDQVQYTFVDVTGDPGYWYACSYFSSKSLLESSKSESILGVGDPALSIISVAELKQIYLFGLDLTDPRGAPMPDSLFEFYIRAAVTLTETRLDVPLRPQVIVDERHDFYPNEARNYLRTYLDNSPVQSVQRFALIYPGNAQVIGQSLPSSWINLDNNQGIISVVPTSYSGTSYFNLGTLGFGAIPTPYLANQDYIPGMIHVDYVAGFPKGVPKDIVEYVAKIASFGPLNIAGDLLGGAGIASQSVSLDGLSQSINTTSSPMFSGYGARLGIYAKEVDDETKGLRMKYKGIQMRVI